MWFSRTLSKCFFLMGYNVTISDSIMVFIQCPLHLEFWMDSWVNINTCETSGSALSVEINIIQQAAKYFQTSEQ